MLVYQRVLFSNDFAASFRIHSLELIRWYIVRGFYKRSRDNCTLRERTTANQKLLKNTIQLRYLQKYCPSNAQTTLGHCGSNASSGSELPTTTGGRNPWSWWSALPVIILWLLMTLLAKATSFKYKPWIFALILFCFTIQWLDAKGCHNGKLQRHRVIMAAG